MKKLPGTRVKDLTGQRYGHLTAVQFAGLQPKTFHSLWRCLCDCGQEVVKKSNHLRTGAIVSCGCKRRNRNGESVSRLYAIWSRYGSGWPSYEAFKEDVGPVKGTLCRLDPSRPLGPGNWQWGTRYDVIRDDSITMNGVTRTLAEWAHRLGTSRQTIWARINISGWDVERAITEPVGKSPGRRKIIIDATK